MPKVVKPPDIGALVEEVMGPQSVASAREEEEADGIEKFISEWGVGATKISVYWIDPRNAKMRYLRTYIPDAVNEEVLRSDFRKIFEANNGVADFQLKLLNEGGKYLKTRTVSIMDVDAMGEKTTIPTAVTLPAIGSNGNDNVASFQQTMFMMMQQQAERTQEMLVALINSLGRGGSNGGTAADIVQAVVSLKEATSTPESKITETLLGKVIERAFDNKASGGDDNIYSVIKEGLSALSSGVIQLPQASANNPPNRPTVTTVPVPRLQPAATAPAETPHATEENKEMTPAQALILLRSRVVYLKGRALAGKDAGLFIDSILENDDEPENGVVIQAVQQYPFEGLSQIDPEIGTNPVLTEWFRTLYHGIKDALSNVDNSSGSVGNGNDAEHHGEPDTASNA